MACGSTGRSRSSSTRSTVLSLPFAIDWQGSPHPSTSSIGGLCLRSLVALHPDPKPLAAIYRALGLEVRVQGAIRPGLAAVLDTPKGEVCLLSA